MSSGAELVNVFTYQIAQRCFNDFCSVDCFTYSALIVLFFFFFFFKLSKDDFADHFVLTVIMFNINFS